MTDMTAQEPGAKLHALELFVNEKLTHKLHSHFDLKDPRKKKNALFPMADLSIWYHLYRYKKERSQFN